MIQLMKKSIDPDALEVLYDRPFTPESFAEDFELKDGKWYVDEEGWLVGGHGLKKAAECVKCGKCEEVCPQHISIREELENIVNVIG